MSLLCIALGVGQLVDLLLTIHNIELNTSHIQYLVILHWSWSAQLFMWWVGGILLSGGWHYHHLACHDIPRLPLANKASYFLNANHALLYRLAKERFCNYLCGNASDILDGFREDWVYCKCKNAENPTYQWVVVLQIYNLHNVQWILKKKRNSSMTDIL